MNIKYT